MEVLGWPPNSPDLNLIGNFWGYIKRLKEFIPQTTDELWDQVETWGNMSAEYCRPTIESIPARLQEAVESNGGCTHY